MNPAARPVAASTRSAGVVLMLASLVIAALPVAAQSGRGAFAQGHLWRIAKAGVGDSYAFGTIHVADPRVAAVPRQIEDALGRSRTLAMELPPVEVVDAQVFELEQLEDGGRLEPLVGGDAWKVLEPVLVAGGTPREVAARLKPWAALMKLDWGGARSDVRSLDENLLSAARMRRMQLVSLESIEEQIAAFDTIPMASQVALLRHALAHRDTLAAGTEWTIEAWLAGDLAALARIPQRVGAQYPGMAPHYAELTRHIIEDRTVVMHHRLFMPLRGGLVFVAVGASHLYGERGLLALLRRDGYRVTRVW
jgi:uncharacterized protein YbaP (TraB family)